MARVLIVDDEEGMREVCAETVSRLPGVEVVTEEDPRRGLERIKAEGFDLLISDVRMPGLSGVELLEAVRAHDPELPVLIMTGFPTVETAVACLKLGAVDFVTKPFVPEDLQANVERFLRERRLREEHALLARQANRDFSYGQLKGSSPAMREVFDVIERVAASDVDVLVFGETGTGKELVARELHRRSERARGRFVPVDCGAIPEALMESELFGHERGAFTGAQGRRIGLLEFADKGTFFLDELGELPLLAQAKLLRALQERVIRRVGGQQEVPVDVRVVAATARDLEREVQEGAFRSDLLYRINVVTLSLPPLRERGEDVLLLAQHFLELHGREGRGPKEISAGAREVLQHYAWPGNVRELQNVIRRGVALARGDAIEVEDLPAKLVESAGGPIAGAPSASGGASLEGGFFELRAQRIAAFERDYLTRLLQDHDGDVAAAAKSAQVPRGTYYRLLKNHDLKPADFRAG
ncbi:MAG: sigma-54 dependent transcriptional regulator [Planctomycetota bacterium]